VLSREFEKPRLRVSFDPKPKLGFAAKLLDDLGTVRAELQDGEGSRHLKAFL
jgi:hypothetical protein